MTRQIGTQMSEVPSSSGAWEWFVLHSQQRMVLLQTFVAVFSAALAGVITLASLKLWGGAFAICCCTTIVAVLFCQLDRRTSELIKLSEQSLLTNGNGDMPNIVREADASVHDFLFLRISYGSLFWYFFVSTTAALWVVATLQFFLSL